MGKFVDLTGKKFNRLKVLGLGDRNSNGQIQWKCKCNCGNIVLATTTYLKTGHTKSCGCLSKEKASKRLKTKKFKQARDKYRKNNFLVNNTSLALISGNKLRANNTSGICGVFWDKNLHKYRARICIKNKEMHLGCYSKIEDAKKARERAEEKYFDPIIEKYNKKIDK